MANFHYIPVRTITTVNNGEEYSSWNMSDNYKAFTIVEYSGSFYLSIDDVPANIQITNLNYWKKLTGSSDNLIPATNAQILHIFE